MKTEQERMDAMEHFNKAVEAFSEIPFVKEYIKADNLEDRKIEGLGILISRWAQWDCLTVLRVMYGALEDSNYHTFNKTIAAEIEKLEKGTPKPASLR